MIRALIFDFDGTILDTETPDYESWNEVYREYWVELSLSVWSAAIGTNPSPLDEVAHLEKLTRQSLDREEISERRRHCYHERVQEATALPGVQNYLEQAPQHGLKCAVASSANHAWVEMHLERLKLIHHFSAIRCCEDVYLTKPAPDLFLAALEALGVEPDEAIVLEDSPNGIEAAREAGIYCVAIPNRVTGKLDLGRANLYTPSLDLLPLSDLLLLAENHKR